MSLSLSDEQHFRNYESALLEVCRNYPNPSIISTNKTAGYERQQLKLALDLYCRSAWPSEIPRATAELVRREFVFSARSTKEFYVGPRKSVAKQSILSIESTTAVQQLPPFDCTNPKTLHSILHLKNFDYIPQAVTLKNLTLDPAELEALYPNISLTQGSNPGEFTLI